MMDSALRLGFTPLRGLLLLLLASAVAAMPSQASGRICVTEIRSTDCANLMAETQGSVTCVQARDRMDCLKMLETGGAEIGLFEAEDLAIASYIFRDKFNVLASVERPGNAGSYGGVLLAKPGDTTNYTISSMCHPGLAFDHFYPSSLTRITPIQDSKHHILPEIQAMIKEASKAYTHACVPGLWSHDPTLDKQLKSEHSHLCQACGQEGCNSKVYAGTANTIKCLSNGVADAAWTTDVEALKLAENPEAEFEYVCPDLTRQPRSEKKPCTWGRRPQAVLLGPLCPGFDCSKHHQVVSTLVQKRELVTTVLGLPLGTKLLPSPSNRENTPPSDVLSKAGLHTSLFESLNSEVNLCVRGEVEEAKCMQLKWAGLAYGVDTGVTCTKTTSTSKCVELIYQRAADAIALDGGEVHDVTRNYDFERILSEVYDAGDHKATSSYYAIAVVHKSSNIKSFKDLQGKKSCHTGIGKTSGWKMPVTELISQHLIQPKHCDFVSAMAEFFSGGSCLPGAKLEKYNPNLSHTDTLCKLCKANCSRGSDEPYYSYTGAFRCLVEGGGDVAFVKHTTVPDNTDSRNSAEWAQNLRAKDFELLCPSGGRAPVGAYKRCNLNLVPAHEVVVRKGLPESRKATIRHVLLTLGAMFKGDSKPSKTFKLFGKFDQIPDLLFKDSSKGLRSLAEDSPAESQAKLNYFRKLDDLHACEVRVCALIGDEDDCELMAAAMHHHGQKVTCVSARDRLDCVKKVSRGQADITPVPGNYLSLFKNLRVMSYLKKPEYYTDTFRYEAVAVVRKSTVSGLEDLKGKKSCHTGYARTTGWRIPMARLKDTGVLETPCTQGKSSVELEMEALSATFSESCVPGMWATTDAVDADLKKRFAAMCAMCKTRTCDRNDEYSGYEGALECLTKNNGDVAFSKLTVAQAFFKDNAGTVNPNDFGFLCPDNKVIDIEGAGTKDCFWAARPWDVYATNAGVSEIKMELLTEFLKLAKVEAEKGPGTATWYFTSLDLSLDFRDMATARHNITTAEYHARSRMDTVAASRVCPQDPVRMCVRSEEEKEKCQDLSSSLAAYGVSPGLACAQARDTPTCINHVAYGQADVIALDGGDFYSASKDHGLQSLLTEVYGEHKNRYYAVAVVRNDSGITTLEDLKGKNSCHTGIEKNTGWRMPIATLRQKGLISKRSCDFPTEVGKFFQASCVPGAKSAHYDIHGTNPESLCELCVGESYEVSLTGLVQVVPREGDQLYKCERNNRELFYSYTGAFRCLVQGGGDVAFVKHSTVLDNTDDNNWDPWASKLKSEDFRLLCVDGGTAEPQNYRECNLAEVPAHVVVTRKSASESRKEDMRHVLFNAVYYFGLSDSFFVLFGKYFERPDLLFKDSTTELALTTDENYADYFAKLYELEQCVNKA